MSFFDTHTHLDFLLEKTGESLTACLNSCHKLEITRIAVMGVYRSQFARVLTLTRARPDTLIAALGLHPLHLARHSEADLAFLEQQLSNEDCRAVGEIGLDRFPPGLTTPDNWRRQCFYFESQLLLAQQFKLPVLIHARRCHSDIYRFLKKIKSRGVIHAFAGSYEEAKHYLDLGFKLGVGGVITYERAVKTRATLKKIPPASLVLETDAPDMPLADGRGQANHPAHLVKIFRNLCLLLDRTPEVLAPLLWRSSTELFTRKL